MNFKYNWLDIRKQKLYLNDFWAVSNRMLIWNQIEMIWIKYVICDLNYLFLELRLVLEN